LRTSLRSLTRSASSPKADFEALCKQDCSGPKAAASDVGGASAVGQELLNKGSLNEHNAKLVFVVGAVAVVIAFRDHLRGLLLVSRRQSKIASAGITGALFLPPPSKIISPQAGLRDTPVARRSRNAFQFQAASVCGGCMKKIAI